VTCSGGRSSSLSYNGLDVHTGFPIHGAPMCIPRDLLLLGQY
jgi:hypothetical protein